MSDPRSHPDFDAAFARAADEVGLQSCYRSSVRPLFGLSRDHWPHCCGGGCEPCADTLIATAERVYELLDIPLSPG